jgi:hypothetical protein
LEEQFQLEFYEKIKSKYEEFEEVKNKTEILKGKFAELLNKPNIVSHFANVRRSSSCEMSLESDYNESLLQTGNNLRKIQDNFNDTALALKSQGSQLKNTKYYTENTRHSVKKATTRVSDLSSSQRCQKLMLNTIAILLFILLVALVILKVIK